MVLSLAGLAGAQVSVTAIEADADPPAIRPFETAVVRARVFGTAAGGERVPLQPGGVQFRIEERDGGWLSSPFSEQEGADGQKLFLRNQPSGRALWRAARMRGAASVGAVLQAPGALPQLRGAVLYTAPEREGLYHIRGVLDGQEAVVEVRVTAAAPSIRTRERVSFPPESHATDPMRKLAEHYAPFIAQETWFDPKADFLARFDFDGNFRGDDNWASTATGSSQAYVYYAGMETATHWFLIYNFFHPRDYAERCFAGSCHENDNEGLILTVRKNGSEFGSLRVMQTLAHNRVYSYRADPRVQEGRQRIAAGVEFFEQSHPLVFGESGGHGVFGSLSDESRYSLARSEFAAGTGVTYVYRGEARRPRHPNDRSVSYDLLPIVDHWWARATDTNGKGDGAFDHLCRYSPLGNRPGISASELR
jgi:hypothetical protein